MSTVTDFYKAAQTLGFGKKYSFRVINWDNGPMGSFNQDQLLYIESLSIPSRKTNTTTVPYKAFDFIVPTNASFPENNRWRVTFVSDNSLLIRSLFEQWSNKLYDPVTNESTLVANNFAPCNLTIEVLDDTDSVARKYKLYGVFPVLVETADYSISESTAVSKLPVTLAFQYFDNLQHGSIKVR
jgi:hypothetical protein